MIIKDREYLTLIHRLKFNGAQIKLNSNDIILIKKSYIGGIFLITNHATDFTSSKGIIRNKLSLKEQYLAQRAKMPTLPLCINQKPLLTFLKLLK